MTDKLKKWLSAAETGLVREADTMIVGAHLDRWPQTTPGTIEEWAWVRYEVDSKILIKPLVGGREVLTVTKNVARSAPSLGRRRQKVCTPTPRGARRRPSGGEARWD